MKRIFTLSLTLLLALSCLTGCGGGNGSPAVDGGSSSDGGAAVKDVLTIAHQQDCGDMNPHGLTSNSYWKIKGQCYETLFYLDYETNAVVPKLASGYEWIDNSTLRITLRQGVQFHNGYGEMTADDVLFSLKEVYNSAANYPIATLDIDRCEKEDDYTIVLRTTEPCSPLVNNLSNCATAIFSQAGFEADNGEFSVDIGTGPFVFDQWLEGESVTQVRFDDYWGGPAKLSKIIWKVIDSDTSRAMELQTGGCDLSYNVSELDRSTLEDKGYVFEKFWINDTNTLVFNCETDLFKDNTTLRRALSYAFDKTKVATVAKNDAERATDLMLDYMHPFGYDDVEDAKAGGADIITFDLEKARELFEEAGYFDPGSDLYNYTFQLKIAPTSEWTGMSQAYKADLESIGVHMDIVSYDYATFVNDLKVTRDFEMAPWGTAPVTGDFDYLALHYFSDSAASINIPQCKNPEFDALVLEYRATTDEAEREALAKQMQNILYDEYYQLPMYETVETFAHSSELKGFKMGMYQTPLLYSCHF